MPQSRSSGLEMVQKQPVQPGLAAAEAEAEAEANIRAHVFRPGGRAVGALVWRDRPELQRGTVLPRPPGGTSSGRNPPRSYSSAIRAERLDSRTAEKVVTASTRVPPQ